MGDSAKTLVPIVGGLVGAAVGQAYLGPLLGAAMGSVGTITPGVAGAILPASSIMGLSPGAIGGAIVGCQLPPPPQIASLSLPASIAGKLDPMTGLLYGR